jgi:hypothetical protein
MTVVPSGNRLHPSNSCRGKYGQFNSATEWRYSGANILETAIAMVLNEPSLKQALLRE